MWYSKGSEFKVAQSTRRMWINLFSDYVRLHDIVRDFGDLSTTDE